MKNYLKDLSVQVIGTLLGAILAILTTKYLYDEQQKAEADSTRLLNSTLIKQEIKNIVVSAEDFLLDTYLQQMCETPRGLSPIVPGTDENGSEKRAAFRLYDVSAWDARSYTIDQALQSSYAKFYNQVRQANYISQKIAYGRYQESEGVRFLRSSLKVAQMGRSLISGNFDGASKYTFKSESKTRTNLTPIGASPNCDQQ